MKFKITKLDIKTGDTNGKFWKKFNFQNAYDKQYYSAFDGPNTNHFAEGYEFEADVEVKGKYRNVKWPKQGFGPSSMPPPDASVHAKLDTIIELLRFQTGVRDPKDAFKEKPEVPYADSEFPTDDDKPF